jgi:uncharacterized alpha-E superfamily protein
MAKKDDELEELEQKIEVLSEWKEKEEREKEVSQRVSAITRVRCYAAISTGSTFLGIVGYLASQVSDALNAGYRAFIRVLLDGGAK